MPAGTATSSRRRPFTRRVPPPTGSPTSDGIQAARAAEADSARDQLHPDLLRLLDAFPTAAAYLMGPTFGILATNAIADALLSPFKGETSMPRILFTHPRARSVFRDWKLVTSATVYALHLNAAGSATPPRSATWPRNCWRCQMSSGPCGTTRPSGSPTRAYKVQPLGQGPQRVLGRAVHRGRGVDPLGGGGRDGDECPDRSSSIDGSTAAMPWSTPHRFTSIIWCHSATRRAASGASAITPALLTSTSMRR